MPPAKHHEEDAPETPDASAIPEGEISPPAVVEVEETPDPALDRVLISHPDIDGAYGEVTRGGFNDLWKSKGFEIVEEKDANQGWTRPSTSNQ